MKQPAVQLWVDDHREYEPGVVHAHLRHARAPLDPQPGDYVVVGDDEIAPALARVISRDGSGALRLRLLAGPAVDHRELPECCPRQPPDNRDGTRSGPRRGRNDCGRSSRWR